jgi:hypothetical protein
MITTAILKIPFTNQKISEYINNNANNSNTEHSFYESEKVSQCNRLTKNPNLEDAGFLSQKIYKKSRRLKLQANYPR